MLRSRARAGGSCHATEQHLEGCNCQNCTFVQSFAISEHQNSEQGYLEALPACPACSCSEVQVPGTG